MEFTIEKPKTWKGLSYPLKTSLLRDPLEALRLDCTVHLHYWTPQNRKDHYNILECEFWPADKKFPNHRFYVRAGVVPSQHRKLAETLLVEKGIPAVVRFIHNKMVQKSNSTKIVDGSCLVIVFHKDQLLINP